MTTRIEELIKSWGNEHYVAYLYVCIGKSDYNLVDEEINEITGKLSLDLSKEKTTEVYEHALRVYNLQSDTEVINFIKVHAADFAESDDVKNKILQNLEDIMEADGIIKDVEMIMYRFIKKILS